MGGVLFGFIADRIGRKRALMLSILTYSLCSFASGLSTGVVSLAVFRFILGLGMGGEWNTGATLVAETWPNDLRAKAIALVQSSWAIGFALAALVAGVVLRYANWRAVFFVGILPAVITLWIRNQVPESDMWKERKRGVADSDAHTPARQSNGDSFLQIFRPPYLKSTVTLLLLNFFGMFGWWGLFTWLPPYLSLPVEQGGRGFGVMGTTSLLVVLNLFGMFPGYASFGWVADHLGRRRSFILYTFTAALLVPLYAMARSQAVLLVLGTVVAFSGLDSSRDRHCRQRNFSYALRSRAGLPQPGRTLSSLAPLTIGWVGQIRAQLGFYLCAMAFLLASIMATQLPETKGRSLE